MRPFTTGSYMYFVLEYVDGGSLFNHMMQRHKYSEKEAANIMKQVMFLLSLLELSYARLQNTRSATLHSLKKTQLFRNAAFADL